MRTLPIYEGDPGTIGSYRITRVPGASYDYAWQHPLEPSVCTLCGHCYLAPCWADHDDRCPCWFQDRRVA